MQAGRHRSNVNALFKDMMQTSSDAFDITNNEMNNYIIYCK